jgi:glycine C-acetyltransferase
MPSDRLTQILEREVAELKTTGIAKGKENIVAEVRQAEESRGPRFLLEGEGQKEFIRLNSNSYLGLGLHPKVVGAEENASSKFGAGPGAVRFISGSYSVHRELETELANFHNRQASMIFSSAYATILSTITSVVTKDTVVISDELNHNCIINGTRMSSPCGKVIYPHLDMETLSSSLKQWAGKAKRALIVTDGVFSMRGDHAPLDQIMDIAREHDHIYEENAVVLVDDSHGVGAMGETGRGVEEFTGSMPVDILVGTLGKAFGVNGGYVTSSQAVVDFLREKSPMYIYSNPITAGEASAARKAVQIVNSAEGKSLLKNLRRLTKHFEDGVTAIGIETIPGDHPVVPLMIRNTDQTRSLTKYLYQNGVLVTGLTYPVVPKGDEEIRVQINADLTMEDIDSVLELLRVYQGRSN